MLLDGDVNPNMPCSSMLELYLLEVRFKSNAGTIAIIYSLNSKDAT